MKRKLVRSKVGSYWCSLYANQIESDVWNIGLIVNKSKRASNDWFERRQNKRSRRAASERKKKSLRQFKSCVDNLFVLLRQLPAGVHAVIINDFQKARALSKYVERFGFMPIPKGDQLVWVLTAQKREEVLRPSKHTT
ncbi:MAG: hypothetical protein FJ184_06720 [Gammaproteobacteria bacterium]|nr:hypothetical protein [Gammaproteobacteria bacterium]